MDSKTQPKLGHSIKSACNMVEVSRGTMHRLIASGAIKVSRVGKKVIVPHSELERIVRDGTGGK